MPNNKNNHGSDYTKEEYINLYLDWVNNFISFHEFIDYYRFSYDQGLCIIDQGKIYNDTLSKNQ